MTERVRPKAAAQAPTSSSPPLPVAVVRGLARARARACAGCERFVVGRARSCMLLAGPGRSRGSLQAAGVLVALPWRAVRVGDVLLSLSAFGSVVAEFAHRVDTPPFRDSGGRIHLGSPCTIQRRRRSLGRNKWVERQQIIQRRRCIAKSVGEGAHGWDSSTPRVDLAKCGRIDLQCRDGHSGDIKW